MVYLYIKNGEIEHYANKEEAQKLLGYGEPDKVITDEEFYQAEGLIRLVKGKIFLGKTDEEIKDEKAKMVREKRNSLLRQTDVYMVKDFPLTKDQEVVISTYRQKLRDLPTEKGFPDVEVPEIPTL